MQDLENSFFSNVEYSDHCWEWVGYRQRKGYGVFSYKSHATQAHRWSYAYFVEKIEPSKMICHHCDNPSCVNPFHLYQGTALDNTIDSIERGRHTKVRNTHCPSGHEYSANNTYTHQGYRRCKVCHKKQRTKIKGGE